MTAGYHSEVARKMYGSYISGNRTVAERMIGADFRFYGPADVGIDREAYFERSGRTPS